MATAEVRAALREPFPHDQVRQREGPARKKLDYVAGETVINRLLTATEGYAWQILGFNVERVDDRWAVTVAGNLMIDGDCGGGVGGMVNADLDMAIKSANTEAIKNAAKNGFGVGLELWDAEYRTQLDQRRRAAGGNEQALKALVWEVAKRKLDNPKPSVTEVADLFGRSAGDLSDPEVLGEILTEEGIL